MTDVLYGFDPATVATDETGNVAPGRTCTVHTAYVGDTPLSTTKAVSPGTLTPGAGTGGIVEADELGRVGFFATDYWDTLYLDFGDGRRWPVNPTKASMATAQAIGPALATKVTDGTLMLDARKFPGVVGNGIADDAAALNAAMVAAKAAGVPLYAKGTFRISSTVFINGDADLWAATFNYDGDGVAVRLGTLGATAMPALSFVHIRCPRIINTAKSGVGWSSVAGTTGLQAINLNTCQVWVRQVLNFEVGLDLTSNTGGHVHTNYYLGALDNNKINCWIRPTNGGWVNSNTLFGGRHAHFSSEGIGVPGTKHIYITRLNSPNPGTVPNMNLWVNTCIETGPGIVEYGIDVESGYYNCWLNPRNEANGDPPHDKLTVRWGPDSRKNVIRDGYALATKLTQVYDGGTGNYIDAQGFVEHQGGGASPFRRYENSTSSTNPILAVYPAGCLSSDYDPDTDWTGQLSSTGLSGKQKADLFSRVLLDFANGRTYYGNGGAATGRYVGAFGSNLGIAGGSLLFAQHSTYDLGSATQAPRDVYAGRYVRLGGVYLRDNDGALEKSTDGNTWTAIGSGGTGGTTTAPQFDVFTANGTWTKPDGAKKVRVVLIAGGQGGASGRRGAAGTVRCGGGGGAGGGLTQVELDPADLPAQVPVTVGAGGTGGAAVTADDTNGNPGTAGSFSQFGSGTTTAVAVTGTAPAGGTAVNGTGGTGGAGTSNGCAGGAASTTGATGGAGTSGAGGGGGGGAGGGITAANVASNGGAGIYSRATSANSSAGGVVDTTTPPVPPAPTLKGMPGGGGGGGAASITQAAQAGANGTGFGAGGGGGGAALNGNNSGAGGAGAPGYVLVVTEF